MQQNQVPPRPFPNRPAVQQDVTLTPKEIVGILRRHLLLIIVFTILGTVAGGGGWFLLKTFAPKYTAKSAIQVDPPGINDPTVFLANATNQDLYYQFRFTKASYMKQQGFLQDLLKIDSIKASNWFKQFDGNIAEAVDNLQKNLGVLAQRDAEWIIVTMTCSSPKESALIVNEAVSSYLKKQDALAKKDVSKDLGQFEVQQKKLEDDLRALEENLASIRKGTDYANLEPSTFRNYLDETLSQTQNNRNSIESQISQLQANIDLLKGRLESEYDETVREEIERDSTALAIRNRITVLEQELASQLTHFGERHRTVVELRDAIDQLYKDLDNRKLMIGNIVRRSRLINVEDTMVTNAKMLETLETQRQRTQEQYRQLSILKAEFARITKLRDEKQKTLEEINLHIEKLRAVHDAPNVSKVSLVFEAMEPLQMSFPQLIVFVPGGFILGTIIGMAVAFLKELANERLRAPSDVAKHLKTRLLSAICHSSEDGELKGIDLFHAVRQAPYSITSECYRQLRTNLRLSDSGTAKKVIYVTSPSIGGGKSTVAVNLASTLAAEGQNVLFMDTHFRNPVSEKAFPKTSNDGAVVASDSGGLSNYLLGQCDLDGVIRPSGIEGLSVIDCGPMPSNSAEILSNSRMSTLLENASVDYDYVIIDGPGLLVTSAKILAAQAEGTILVCNANSTKRGEANRTLRELREINAHVVGVVLVGVRAMKGGYFQEKYKLFRKYNKLQVPAAM